MHGSNRRVYHTHCLELIVLAFPSLKDTKILLACQ
jgi:hypothetical protein